jgi:glutathione peroxidase
MVLAFANNQFDMEPGTGKEIYEFYTNTYNTSFPIFANVNVSGPNANKVWKYLAD